MHYPVKIIRSNRKSIGIQISPDGDVIVRAPYFLPKREIEALVEAKQDWIDKQLSMQCLTPKLSDSELQELIKKATEYMPSRVEYFSKIIGTDYGRITIRCQKTRWGSCSSKGNLNFNCLLMLTPEKVIDSVVVHELCHRIEMNHSKRFYELVYKAMPDYDSYHKWLKENGQSLITKIT